MKCIDCGQALRPRGVSVEDAPGTHRVQPGPRCSPCYKVAPLKGKPRATECVDCERPLRPRDESVNDYPGTILHWGQGRCQSCWRAVRGITKSRKNTRPTNCKDCGGVLRSSHATEADYPGTVRHAGGGVCRICKLKRKNATRKPVAPAPKPEPVVEAPPVKPVEVLPHITDPGAARFHAARKARLEKAERVKQLRIGQEQARARFIASQRKVNA